MASLIFAHAKHIVKNARKTAMEFAKTDEQLGYDYKERYDQYYEQFIQNEQTEFDEYLRVSKLLHNQFLAFNPSRQAYFITIRPNDNKCTFLDFKEKVESFIKRACFTKCTYSFEQKGTSPFNIGSGFHVHIVTQSTHRSKGECLRDTLSSWKQWIESEKIASNCIDVAVTKNAENLVQNYLIDYKSDDEHKIATKSIDELWRLNEGLQPLYKKE